MKNFVAGGPNIPQARGGGSGFGRNLAAMAMGFMGTRNRMMEERQRNINEIAMHMTKRDLTDSADKEMGNHWITAAVHANKTFTDNGMPGVEALNAGGIRVQTAYKGNERRTPEDGEKATTSKPETTDTAPTSSTSAPKPTRSGNFTETSAAVRGEKIDAEQAIDISPAYGQKYAAFHAANDVRVQSGLKPRKSKNFPKVSANLNGNSDSTNGNKA